MCTVRARIAIAAIASTLVLLMSLCARQARELRAARREVDMLHAREGMARAFLFHEAQVRQERLEKYP